MHVVFLLAVLAVRILLHVHEREGEDDARDGQVHAVHQDAHVAGGAWPQQLEGMLRRKESEAAVGLPPPKPIEFYGRCSQKQESIVSCCWLGPPITGARARSRFRSDANDSIAGRK